MSERMNIALLWMTSMALMVDLVAVMYLMVAFRW